MDLGGENLFTIGEVAAMLGVSTHTVRAWERRHGIVRPIRTQTSHRRYREQDVDLLRNVKLAANMNGVSLKLAYQHITGSQTIEPRLATTGKSPSQRMLPVPQGNLWRGVVDVLPHLVAVIDAEGRIVEANIVGAKTFGVVVQRLRGRLFLDLVSAAERAKAALLYTPTLRAVRGWELDLATVNGVRPYSFQSWFVRQEQEMLLALVGSEMSAAEGSARRLDG